MDNEAANQKDMASKAHADVHADEAATVDGRTARLKIFRVVSSTATCKRLSRQSSFFFSR